MTKRIFTLSQYFFMNMVFSLAGLLHILLALAFYIIFFDPRQQTPDVDYYILVLGVFGLIMAFLSTVTISARANKAVHFPFLVRLPSRVEYLISVLIAGLTFTTILQAVIALISLLLQGPEIGFIDFATIPPIWISGNILFTIFALHASDLVTDGWSRVYVFGIIGILLYLQSGMNFLRDGLSSLFNSLGTTFLEQGFDSMATTLFNAGNWVIGSGSELFDTIIGAVFWPFRAIANAVIEGNFTLSQALAPAIILLYATVLFLLAARFFGYKDLFLTE